MIYTVTLNPALDLELTVGRMEFDKVLPAVEERVDPGGKGFNVTRLLRSLGMPAVSLGFVGGSIGKHLQELLQALDIETDFVWIEGETRTNISIVTGSHDHYLKVNEKGPRVDLKEQAVLLDKMESLAKPGDWWVLAGSLPPGVDEDFYARMIHILNDRHARVVLDTSGQPLQLGCRELPFLIKPNAEEARAVTGITAQNPDRAVRAALELRRRGAQNVVISLGRSGALLQTGDAAWLAHPPEVKEKNPIGAGDSMVGGLVWALAQGFPLDEALCWGVASGAAAAGLRGTAVGSMAVITGLRQQVRLERFSTLSSG